jgi:hypothetical protein
MRIEAFAMQCAVDLQDREYLADVWSAGKRGVAEKFTGVVL